MDNDEAFLNDFLSNEDLEFDDDHYMEEAPAYDEYWIFDMLEDNDIITFLYSGYVLTEDNMYYLKNWFNEEY